MRTAIGKGNSRPVVVLHLLLVSACAGADSALGPRDLALIEEAYHVWTTQVDAVWQGAGSIRTPMVYVGTTEEYAIGFARPLKGFSRASGVSGKTVEVQVRARTFPVNISACLEVDGVISVVMGRPEALEKSPESWVLTAVHEMFHGYQHSGGAAAKIDTLEIGPKENAAWHLTFPFPYSDADTMRLIHLQGHLLWLAFTTSNSDDMKYNAGSSVDAAIVYRDRLNSLMPDGKAQKYSAFQEWSEGVAAYTEFRVAQMIGRSNYPPTAAFSALPDFQGYPSVWKADYSNRPFLVKHAGRATKSRTAFYHLGMGKALALDGILPDWKRKYLLPGIWLDDLLNEALAPPR